VAIGLLVGIAALGVVAARAAIERRQEIGVLRAIGVDRGVIAAALLLESGLVVLLGSALGVGLGLLLCRNVFAVQLFDRLRAGMEMVVPYDQVALTVGLTCLAGLGATILPALRAAAVPPIAAIRGE
jgi:putative ABC transport system permease protein